MYFEPSKAVSSCPSSFLNACHLHPLYHRSRTRPEMDLCLRAVLLVGLHDIPSAEFLPRSHLEQKMSGLPSARHRYPDHSKMNGAILSGLSLHSLAGLSAGFLSIRLVSTFYSMYDLCKNHLYQEGGTEPQHFLSHLPLPRDSPAETGRAASGERD